MTSAVALLNIATSTEPSLQRTDAFAAALTAVTQHVQQLLRLRDVSEDSVQSSASAREPDETHVDAEHPVSDVQWRAIEGHAALQVERATELRPEFPVVLCADMSAPTVSADTEGRHGRTTTAQGDPAVLIGNQSCCSGSVAQQSSTRSSAAPASAVVAVVSSSVDAAVDQTADRQAAGAASSSGRGASFEESSMQPRGVNAAATAALRQALTSSRPLQQAAGLLRYLRASDAQTWPQGAQLLQAHAQCHVVTCLLRTYSVPTPPT